jgi:hypothetical protein
MSAPVPTRVEHSIKTSLYLQTFGESDGNIGDSSQEPLVPSRAFHTARSFCDLPDETQQYLSWWDEPAGDTDSDSTSEDTHTAHEYELDSSDDSDEYEPIIEWAEPAQKHKRTGSRAGMSSRTCTRGMQRSFSYDDLDKVESFRLSSDISIEDGLVMLRHPYKLDSAEMRRTAVWFSRIQRKHSM